MNDLIELVTIQGGSFLMGSPKDEEGRHKDEGPQHEVKVPSFLMGKFPVTQSQWRVVAALPEVKLELDADPSFFKGNNRPVERVSWYEAVEFCQRLSRQTGSEYRLPTEAEWEFACRAGTCTPFCFGTTLTSDLANYDANYTYGDGLKGQYREQTTDVGSFPANDLGLYDMQGNVWEWCQDHWHSNYDGAPTDGSVWLTNNKNASRVLRGGSWFSYPWNCRSAYRDYLTPDLRLITFGFRVVCSAPRDLAL